MTMASSFSFNQLPRHRLAGCCTSGLHVSTKAKKVFNMVIVVDSAEKIKHMVKICSRMLDICPSTKLSDNF